MIQEIYKEKITKATNEVTEKEESWKVAEAFGKLKREKKAAKAAEDTAGGTTGSDGSGRESEDSSTRRQSPAGPAVRGVEWTRMTRKNLGEGTLRTFDVEYGPDVVKSHSRLMAPPTRPTWLGLSR